MLSYYAEMCAARGLESIIASNASPWVAPHGATGPGHFAFAITAEALETWRTRLRESGVAIEHETHWPGGAKSLYFRDPAGNCLELLTPGLWGLTSGW